MLFVLSFLMFVIFVQAELCEFGNIDFVCLKKTLQKINKLEDLIPKIKYIHGEKISFELMDLVTKFDLFCQSEFPQQIITYSKAVKCLETIHILWYKQNPYLEHKEFTLVNNLLINWKYLNIEYVNLKVVLLEIIYTYVEYEKQLNDIYNLKYEYKNNELEIRICKLESKEKIIELMMNSLS